MPPLCPPCLTHHPRSVHDHRCSPHSCLTSFPYSSLYRSLPLSSLSFLNHFPAMSNSCRVSLQHTLRNLLLFYLSTADQCSHWLPFLIFYHQHWIFQLSSPLFTCHPLFHPPPIPLSHISIPAITDHLSPPPATSGSNTLPSISSLHTLNFLVICSL